MYNYDNLIKTTKGLLAPREYFDAPRKFIEELVNGCGPSGWKIDIVPDTIYGLSVTEACNIHDWMYEYGTTLEDKDIADKVMYENIITLIENKENAWIITTLLRKRRAKTMYKAVQRFGDGPFADKEKRTV